ncbi:sensor histidine kinase [Mucilaginibacter angelicae]|uniref:Sensor histidine kinase n=1 Tax=Mucilaginibacter angelicae TaxID=869718 RepID=A0ABV6L212_9SPHI
MAFSHFNQSWFVRYKLYHIPFWVLYNYLLFSLAIDSPTQAAHEYFFSVYFVKCFFYVLFPAFAVYLNLYFLIPHFLQKGHYGWYFFLLALTIAASSVLIIPGYYLSAWLAGGSARTMFGLNGDWNSFYHLAKSDPLKSTIAATTLGMSIKLTKNWMETQRRQRELEKEKLETELKFLKYQFNPHFLFNSINSIFFLIHKNPDIASASLAQFSDLLRHQLYESNDSLIPLKKEIAYLENFIELEKLRQSPDLKTVFNIDDDYSPGLGIAPFILMTFVENAFKHVSKHKDSPNWIRMDLKIDGQSLKMIIANSRADNDSQQVIHYGGIGLKNVQRRLDLLYPECYQLDIQQSDEDFRVIFELQLAEVSVSASLEFMDK